MSTPAGAHSLISSKNRDTLLHERRTSLVAVRDAGDARAGLAPDTLEARAKRDADRRGLSEKAEVRAIRTGAIRAGNEAVGETQALKPAILVEWMRSYEGEQRNFNSAVLDAELRLSRAQTFESGPGVKTELSTAVAFEVLDSIFTVFGRYQSLLTAVRRILLQAVYVDTTSIGPPGTQDAPDDDDPGAAGGASDADGHSGYASTTAHSRAVRTGQYFQAQPYFQLAQRQQAQLLYHEQKLVNLQDKLDLIDAQKRALAEAKAKFGRSKIVGLWRNAALRASETRRRSVLMNEAEALRLSVEELKVRAKETNDPLEEILAKYLSLRRTSDQDSVMLSLVDHSKPGTCIKLLNYLASIMPWEEIKAAMVERLRETDGSDVLALLRDSLEARLRDGDYASRQALIDDTLGLLVDAGLKLPDSDGASADSGGEGGGESGDGTHGKRRKSKSLTVDTAKHGGSGGGAGERRRSVDLTGRAAGGDSKGNALAASPNAAAGAAALRGVLSPTSGSAALAAMTVDETNRALTFKALVAKANDTERARLMRYLGMWDGELTFQSIDHSADDAAHDRRAKADSPGGGGGGVKRIADGSSSSYDDGGSASDGGDSGSGSGTGSASGSDDEGGTGGNMIQRGGGDSASADEAALADLTDPAAHAAAAKRSQAFLEALSKQERYLLFTAIADMDGYAIMDMGADATGVGFGGGKWGAGQDGAGGGATMRKAAMGVALSRDQVTHNKKFNAAASRRAEANGVPLDTALGRLADGTFSIGARRCTKEERAAVDAIAAILGDLDGDPARVIAEILKMMTSDQRMGAVLSALSSMTRDELERLLLEVKNALGRGMTDDKGVQVSDADIGTDAQVAAKGSPFDQDLAGRLGRTLSHLNIMAPLPFAKYELKPPKGIKIQRLPRDSALTLMYEALQKKIIADEADDREHNERQTLPDFLKDYLLNRYGLPSMADGYLYALVKLILKLSEQHPRIEMFGSLCGVLNPDCFCGRVCDVALLLVKKLFPVPQFPAILKARPEGHCFVLADKARAACEAIFVTDQVFMYREMMQLTAGRMGALRDALNSACEPWSAVQERLEAVESAKRDKKGKKGKGKKGKSRSRGGVAAGGADGSGSPGAAGRKKSVVSGAVGGDIFKPSDQVIDFDFLCQLVLDMWREQDEDDGIVIRYTFKLFDEDKSGTFSFDELQTMLAACAKEDDTDASTPGGGKAPKRYGPKSVTTRQALTMFRKMGELSGGEGGGDNVNPEAFSLVCREFGVTPNYNLRDAAAAARYNDRRGRRRTTVGAPGARRRTSILGADAAAAVAAAAAGAAGSAQGLDPLAAARAASLHSYDSFRDPAVLLARKLSEPHIGSSAAGGPLAAVDSEEEDDDDDAVA